MKSQPATRPVSSPRAAIISPTNAFAALHQRLTERGRDRNPPVLVVHPPVAIVTGRHVRESVGQTLAGLEQEKVLLLILPEGDAQFLEQSQLCTAGFFPDLVDGGPDERLAGQDCRLCIEKAKRNTLALTAG